MYRCPSEGCNRKYKTTPKLRLHCQKIHPSISEDELEKHVTSETERIEAGIPLPAPTPSRTTRSPTLVSTPSSSSSTKPESGRIAFQKRREVLEKEYQVKMAQQEIRLAQQQQILKASQVQQEQELKRKEAQIQQEADQKMQEYRQQLLMEAPDEITCRICFTAERDSVIVDCGHEVACYDCLTQLKQRKPTQFTCPGCRTPITHYIRRYRL